MMMAFGKHKGKTLEEIEHADPSYIDWLLSLSDPKRIKIQQQCKLIKNKRNDVLCEDKYLKNAWYSQPAAEILVKYHLDPSLCGFWGLGVDKQVEMFESVTASTMEKAALAEYTKQIGHEQSPENAYSFLWDNNLLFSVDDSLFKVEIAKAALSLRECVKNNQDQDSINREIPSKLILPYWCKCRPESSGKKDNEGTGKWLLFYDKLLEDERGLTELDRAYMTLSAHCQQISEQFYFKCSTRRPNPNSNNVHSGVICYYCDENSRDSVILKIHELLRLECTVYWKSHSSLYSKDGHKVTDYCFNPTNH